jgi:hypothetical protein
MKAEIIYSSSDNDKHTVTCKSIKIDIGTDVEFIITINQFDELVINKQSYGKSKSSITIEPRVSNEICIS